MPAQTIENRVERLERRVTNLEKLPARIGGLESQVLQLRTEVREGFSAIREEIRAGDEETRRALGEQIANTNRQMRMLHEDVISRLAILQEGPAVGRTRGSRGRKKST